MIINPIWWRLFNTKFTNSLIDDLKEFQTLLGNLSKTNATSSKVTNCLALIKITIKDIKAAAKYTLKLLTLDKQKNKKERLLVVAKLQKAKKEKQLQIKMLLSKLSTFLHLQKEHTELNTSQLEISTYSKLLSLHP